MDLQFISYKSAIYKFNHYFKFTFLTSKISKDCQIYIEVGQEVPSVWLGKIPFDGDHPQGENLCELMTLCVTDILENEQEHNKILCLDSFLDMFQKHDDKEILSMLTEDDFIKMSKISGEKKAKKGSKK